MEIIKTNVDVNDKKAIYKLTKNSSMMVQDAPSGLSVPVASWALYNDPKTDKNGESKENKVLSFVDTSDVKYSTISATFIREFLYITDIMGSDPFAIILLHGTSNKGKAFVSCELDCNF